jgi:hypothetical protein
MTYTGPAKIYLREARAAHQPGRAAQASAGVMKLTAPTWSSGP